MDLEAALNATATEMLEDAQATIQANEEIPIMTAWICPDGKTRYRMICMAETDASPTQMQRGVDRLLETLRDETRALASVVVIEALVGIVPPDHPREKARMEDALIVTVSSPTKTSSVVLPYRRTADGVVWDEALPGALADGHGDPWKSTRAAARRSTLN